MRLPATDCGFKEWRLVGRFLMEAGQWWEIMLNIRPQRGGYDPMGGGTVWSQGGIGGQPEVVFL
jgi:hypothetical protein